MLTEGEDQLRHERKALKGQIACQFLVILRVNPMTEGLLPRYGPDNTHTVSGDWVDWVDWVDSADPFGSANSRSVLS